MNEMAQPEDRQSRLEDHYRYIVVSRQEMFKSLSKITAFILLVGAAVAWYVGNAWVLAASIAYAFFKGFGMARKWMTQVVRTTGLTEAEVIRLWDHFKAQQSAHKP